MERDYLYTMYTEEDEKGFQFSNMPEEEKNLQIMQLEAKRNKWRLIVIAFLILAILIYYVIKTEMGKYYIGCGAAFFIFLLGLHIHTYTLKIKHLKHDKAQYFEVEILEKLPEERETRYNDQGPNSKHYFYPVIGKDIATGYESLCYITEEQYLRSQPYDVIQILRFVKNKRKK